MTKRSISPRSFLGSALFIAAAFLYAYSAPIVAYATWDGESYSQGETLDPECTPEDDSCTVSLPEPGNFTSLGGITYIGTVGETINGPESGDTQLIENAESGKYFARVASGHLYRIYAYKNTEAGRVYSTRYLEISVLDEGEISRYDVGLEWDSIEDADGYRVLGQAALTFDWMDWRTGFDQYVDVEDNFLTDSTEVVWLEGSNVTPKSFAIAVDEESKTVGINMFPSSTYSLSVGGDSFTNGALYFGNENLAQGAVHYGTSGYYGQARNWLPDSRGAGDQLDDHGVWIEGGTRQESGGFYGGGNMAAIWSAGDTDILRVYDEDALASNNAAFVVDRSGGLRSDTGALQFNDSAAFNWGSVVIRQQDPQDAEEISNGTFENGSTDWDVEPGWTIHDGIASFDIQSPTAVFKSRNTNIASVGSDYTVGDELTVSEGELEARFRVVYVAGPVTAVSVRNSGSGYVVGDIANLQGGAPSGDDLAQVEVTSIGSEGQITGLNIVRAGNGYSTNQNSGYWLDGGSGSGATVLTTVLSGVLDSVENITSSTGFFYDTPYSVVGGSGTGGAVIIDTGEFHTLGQWGVLSDGQTYSVSLYIGGDQGSVDVCLGWENCRNFSAGSGNVTFTNIWQDEGDKIQINASSDFNGYVDSISVSPQQGLTFVGSNGRPSVTIGYDEASGYSYDGQHGFMIQTTDSEGGSRTASLYLPDDTNARYEYHLPSLASTPDGIDEFCMKYLGNCSGGGFEKAGPNNVVLAEGLVGIGSVSTDAKFSINAQTYGTQVLSVIQELGMDGADIVDVVSQGDYAYILENSMGAGILHAVDIENLSDMQVVGSYELTGFASRIQVAGTRVYITEGSTLEAIDVSYPSFMRQLFTYSFDYSIGDIAVAGNLIYVADGDGGLIVLNSVNPQDVAVIASNSQPSSAVAISGDYAYTTYNAVMDVWDITGVHNGFLPPRIGHAGVEGVLSGRIAVDGDFVYSINDTNNADESFVVFDVSDKTDPFIAGYANIGSYRVAGSVFVKDNYAYVADGASDSLYVFDVSNVDTITEIDHFITFAGNSFGVAVTGDNGILLAAGIDGLISFVLTNNNYPSLALRTGGGDVVIGGLSEGMRFLNFGDTSGSLGYGIRNNNGVMQYKNDGGEWTDFGSGGSGSWSTNSGGISYGGGNVGIGTTNPRAGIDIVGYGNGVRLSQVGHYTGTETWVVDLTVSGNRLYSADGTRLDVFDISNPATETLLGSYDVGDDQVNAVKANGAIVYIAHAQSVQVLDTTDPENIVSAGSYTTVGTIQDLDYHNGVLYVIDSNSNLSLLDVSDITSTSPSDPVLITGLPYSTDGFPYRIAAQGEFVYISESGCMEVVDVTDLESPQFVTCFSDVDSDTFVGAIATSGNYVYAQQDTNGEKDFTVIDVTDPWYPETVGTLDLGTNFMYDGRMAVDGSMVYLADGAPDSLFAINVSAPASPYLVDYVESDGTSLGVAVSKNHVFLADGGSHIFAYKKPGNYAALFQAGNVGIGTDSPAFSLDVAARAATATLTITANDITDPECFLLVDTTGYVWSYEFDADGTTMCGNSISMVVDPGIDTTRVSLGVLLDRTAEAIEDGGAFFVKRSGNSLIISQAVTGDAGNTINSIMTDENWQEHPSHSSTAGSFALTDFTGGMDGSVNIGGNLYKNGLLFTGSQWTDVAGGIEYSSGDLSIGNGLFFYDSGNGETSIDNLNLGAMSFPDDAGIVSWIDMPVTTSSSNGTVLSYTASLAGLSMLTIYGEADGSGGVVDTGINMQNLPVLGGTAGYLCISAQGDLLTADAGCDVSSMRFKQDVSALSDDSGLAEVLRLNPVSFFYRPEVSAGLSANFSNEQVGFIAEEVAGVDPRLAVYEKDGTTVLGVKYEKITAVLAKAIQEIASWTTAFISKKVTTEKLCMGDTCVTESELKLLLQNAGLQGVSESQPEPESGEGVEDTPEETTTDGQTEDQPETLDSGDQEPASPDEDVDINITTDTGDTSGDAGQS